MKPLRFIGTSLDDLRAFPDQARQKAGYELDSVQRGEDPSDWKPMRAIGPGVRELRIRVSAGAFRVIYVAAFADFVAVLHCFRKKSEQTSLRDIALAKARLKEAMQRRMV
jgi:phage-related protein